MRRKQIHRAPEAGFTLQVPADLWRRIEDAALEQHRNPVGLLREYLHERFPPPVTADDRQSEPVQP
jgi:hypothetical protein